MLKSYYFSLNLSILTVRMIIFIVKFNEFGLKYRVFSCSWQKIKVDGRYFTLKSWYFSLNLSILTVRMSIFIVKINKIWPKYRVFSCFWRKIKVDGRYFTLKSYYFSLNLSILTVRIIFYRKIQQVWVKVSCFFTFLTEN